MNNFRKELDRYGKQLREEKCPLSDAMLDKAIRHAIWQERESKDAPHIRKKQHRWPWLAAAACIVALLVPLTISIIKRQSTPSGSDFTFACNIGCNSQDILARLDNIINIKK